MGGSLILPQPFTKHVLKIIADDAEVLSPMLERKNFAVSYKSVDKIRRNINSVLCVKREKEGFRKGYSHVQLFYRNYFEILTYGQ